MYYTNKLWLNSYHILIKGNIQIPIETIPFLANERVIEVKSFVYKLNFWDWCRIIFTIGYAYCCGENPIRPRRFQRAVLLLTNCRIISLYICHRAGEVPSHLTNFAFSATSYFPGNIKAGTILCDGVNHVNSSLLCEGGHLSVSMHNLNNFCTFPLNLCPKTCPVTTLDPTFISFAKKMQNVIAKGTPLDLKVKKFVIEEKEEKIGLFDEGALGKVINKVGDKIAAGVVSIGDDEANRNKFSEFEKSILPLTENEILINRFTASESYSPCCECCEGCYLCSAECGPCAMCCTCGVRPYTNSNKSMVTSNAIYHISSSRTFPWPCVKSCVPPGVEGFVVAWSPIRSFKGQILSWQASGILPKNEKGILGGKYKKEPGPSEFKFTIMLDGFSFEYTGSKKDRNWLVDDELRYEQTVISELQLTLLDIEMGRFQPIPPPETNSMNDRLPSTILP